MKISRNLTRQDITPSDGNQNWNKGSLHFWQSITDGLIVEKTLEGEISLAIDNSTDPRHLNCFFGNLYNKTTGIITPIVPPMKNTRIWLDPRDHYILIITQMFTKTNHQGYIIDTHTLDFAPD